MNEPVEFLDLDDVIGLAVALIGDPAPMCGLGLLGSAVSRPQTAAFGDDAYSGIWTKAAALLQSVVTHQALVDGGPRNLAVSLGATPDQWSMANRATLQSDASLIAHGLHREVEEIDSRSELNVERIGVFR